MRLRKDIKDYRNELSKKHGYKNSEFADIAEDKFIHGFNIAYDMLKQEIIESQARNRYLEEIILWSKHLFKKNNLPTIVIEKAIKNMEKSSIVCEDVNVIEGSKKDTWLCYRDKDEKANGLLVVWE